MRKIAILSLLVVFLFAIPAVSAIDPPQVELYDTPIVTTSNYVYATSENAKLRFTDSSGHLDAVHLYDVDWALRGIMKAFDFSNGVATVNLKNEIGQTSRTLEGIHATVYYGINNGLMAAGTGGTYNFIIDTTAPTIVKLEYDVKLTFNPEISFNPFKFKLFDASMDLDVVVHDFYGLNGANAVAQSGIQSITIDAPGVDFSETYDDDSEQGEKLRSTFEISVQDWLSVKQGASVEAYAKDWAGHSTTMTEYSETSLLKALTPWLMDNYT